MLTRDPAWGLRQIEDLLREIPKEVDRLKNRARRTGGEVDPQEILDSLDRISQKIQRGLR